MTNNSNNTSNKTDVNVMLDYERDENHSIINTTSSHFAFLSTLSFMYSSSSSSASSQTPDSHLRAI